MNTTWTSIRCTNWLQIVRYIHLHMLHRGRVPLTSPPHPPFSQPESSFACDQTLISVKYTLSYRHVHQSSASLKKGVAKYTQCLLPPAKNPVWTPPLPPEIYIWSYRANTSALSTHPMMFPRWGTLLTYGKALVIKMFLSPGSGRLEWVGRVDRLTGGEKDKQVNGKIRRITYSFICINMGLGTHYPMSTHNM